MNKIFKSAGVYIVILALIFGFAIFLNYEPVEDTSQIALSDMIEYLNEEKDGKDVIEEITVEGTDITMVLSGKDQKTVYTTFSSSAELQCIVDEYIIPLGDDVKYSSAPKKESVLANILPTLIMVGVLIFLFMFMMNQGGGGKANSFGRSRAKLQKTGASKVTFKDVAGLDEEKEELQEVVDFLRNPKKYKDIGARIPKGMLLVGPPGTGKTYLSKAAAGEAGVPFFTISGSDFVEMFVGVGASRVRDLFDQAKKNSPCIVFIDEIDAVGRKRGAGLGGGNDEREQTLNQLLVEMDGFAENSGTIILAATNRPDVLDPALLRPGRFDRQVVIGLPDVKGREEIFKVHSRNKQLAEDVDLKVLARRTPGYSPADIENLLNEAALITARRNGKVIRMEELEEAATKVMAGPAKKSRVISEKEKILTAYHEAGHAVATRTIPGTDPVHQVTIIPRGRAGGFTMYLPTEDTMYDTKKSMFNFIVTCLGGRVAEQLKLDDISTGASNDIQRATDVARDMVTKYGFSERLGAVNYNDSDEVFLGKDFTSSKKYSEEVAAEIDEEIRRIIGEAYDEATRILTENDEVLERVAQGLLYAETLDAEQFEKLYTGEYSVEDLKASMEEADRVKAEKNAIEEAETLAALEEKPEEPTVEPVAEETAEPAETVEEEKIEGDFKTYEDIKAEEEPAEEKKEEASEEE